MSDAFIVSPIRTPIGRYGGALSAVRADDLAGLVLKRLIERSGVPADRIDDVILGCANQAGEDNRNVARMAVLLAGFPQSVPATTLNRLCGSALDAIIYAARAVRSGEADLVIAGGVEVMSRAPYVMAKNVSGAAQFGNHFRPLGFVEPRPPHGELQPGAGQRHVCRRSLTLAVEMRQGRGVFAACFQTRRSRSLTRA